MNKADKIFIENCKNILKHGVSTENEKVRPVYKDGTPAHTIFVTQVSETYDISKDEFPIISLRPIPWKNGIKEMLAIYQTQLNTKEGFEKHGIRWWEPWYDKYGTIGRAYPHNLESHRNFEVIKEVIKVKRRIVDEEFGEIKEINVNEIKNFDKENLVRDFYNTLDYDKKTRKYLLQSIVTGEKQWVSRNFVKGTGIKKNGWPFRYDRILYNVGYLGNYENIKNFSDEEIKILRHRWVCMLKRCYSKESSKKVFVHSDWHSFENFLKDIRYLPQYHLAKEDNFNGWELDKDYFGSNCYSKDTVVFLKSDENKIYGKSVPITLIHPNGREEFFLSIKDASVKHKLNYSNLQHTLYGKRNHTKNFKAIPFEENDILFRYELSRNQMNELLYNLKNNPYSRRHIISFWNWANIDKKNLVECAYETLWTVRGEYLDMTLVQR